MSNFNSSFSNSFGEEVQATLPRLQNLWDEIGFSEEEQTLKLISFKDIIKRFFNNEEKFKDNLLKKISDNGAELYKLSKSLGEYSEDLFDGSSDGKLLEVQDNLEKSIRVMKSKIKERKEELSILLRQEQELCEQLIEDPSEISLRDVPSLDDINDIQRRINTLEKEKVHRLRTFSNLKAEASELLKELDEEPSKFLKSCLYGREDMFTLSLHNLEDLRQAKKELSLRVKENKIKLESLKSSVQLLWDRLLIAEIEQKDFVASLTSSTPSNIEIYQYELEKLEQLKKANMSRIIAQLKVELEQLWEKTYTSEQDRVLCQAYQSENASEEVMLSLEDEVKCLASKYESAKPIYELLHKRKTLWNTLSELEQKSTDSNRYKNRGGALLQEERKRNHIKSELPKVEEVLKERVEEWQANQSGSRGLTIFSIMGMTVTDYIDKEWDAYHEKKMLGTRDRAIARNAQLQQEAKLGAKPPQSSKRRLNQAPSMRSLRSNASTISSTMYRSTASSQLTATRSSSRLALAEQSPNVPFKRQLEGLEQKNTRPMKRFKEDVENDLDTYSRFAESIYHRSEADQMRSSVLASPATPNTRRFTPSKPPQTVPRNFQFSRTSANTTSSNRLLPPTTPKQKGGVSAAFATPSRFKTPMSRYKSSPANLTKNSCRSVPPRRRSARLAPSTSQSRLGCSKSGSTLKLTTPVQNKLRFLI